MKIITFMTALLISQFSWASDDRQQINQAMDCFFEWDLLGLNETEAEKCIHPDVLYHRVTDNEWKTNKRELTFKGKGKDTYHYHINSVHIDTDIAVVTALFRYNPGPNERPYIKTIILHKVKQGWRVTNVFWGKNSPQL